MRGAFIGIAAVLGLAACQAHPAETKVVAKLENGCAVTKVYDGESAEPVYVTTCPDRKPVTQWDTTENCGKACTKRVPHKTEIAE